MKEKSAKSTVTEKELNRALIKKALGYDYTEVVEEYSESDEGEIRLTKKKVTKKNVPPDLSALKILIDGKKTDVSAMTDEELEREKERLFRQLAEKEKLKERKVAKKS